MMTNHVEHLVLALICPDCMNKKMYLGYVECISETTIILGALLFYQIHDRVKRQDLGKAISGNDESNNCTGVQARLNNFI